MREITIVYSQYFQCGSHHHSTVHYKHAVWNEGESWDDVCAREIENDPSAVNHVFEGHVRLFDVSKEEANPVRVATALLRKFNEFIEFHTKESFDDDAWSKIYDKVFVKENMRIVRGLQLEWCDPDTSYEEDVRALVHALERYVKENS